MKALEFVLSNKRENIETHDIENNNHRMSSGPADGISIANDGDNMEIIYIIRESHPGLREPHNIILGYFVKAEEGKIYIRRIPFRERKRIEALIRKINNFIILFARDP